MFISDPASTGTTLSLWLRFFRGRLSRAPGKRDCIETPWALMRYHSSTYLVGTLSLLFIRLGIVALHVGR